MCAYVYIYVYIYMYIYMYICTYIYIHLFFNRYLPLLTAFSERAQSAGANFCYSTPVRRVENVNDDLPLLVDGVQFDAAIVTVSAKH